MDGRIRDFPRAQWRLAKAGLWISTQRREFVRITWSVKAKALVPALAAVLCENSTTMVGRLNKANAIGRGDYEEIGIVGMGWVGSSVAISTLVSGLASRAAAI
jgi:hypothetical protein